MTPKWSSFLGLQMIVYQPEKEDKVANALSRKEDSPMIWVVYKEDKQGLMALSGS